MKNIIKLLIFISIINVNAQSFNCVKTIQKNGCSIELYNSTNNKIGDIDLSNFSWYYQTLQNIKISDDINVFNLINTCITTPTWSSLADSLNSWKVQCSVASIPSNLDTTQVDTSLINYIFQFDRQNDTLSAILNAIKTKEDTSNQAILNMIKQNLSDSLRTSVYVNNDSINVHVLNSVVDSTYYVLLDSIVKLLQRDTTKDTLKVLTFKPLTKNIAGTVDTLYNCKGLSFRANSTTTGTLILYYEDGETDSYDLTTEDLPTWDNSTFISFVGYDATGVVGKLRINAVGCSQVPDNGCAKVVPLLDCESSTPIPTCVGWASGSGVWSSISGCWNTGQ
jgi:hypothetical protein